MFTNIDYNDMSSNMWETRNVYNNLLQSTTCICEKIIEFKLKNIINRGSLT